MSHESIELSRTTGAWALIISTPAEGAVSGRTHPQISGFYFKKREMIQVVEREDTEAHTTPAPVRSDTIDQLMLEKSMRTPRLPPITRSIMPFV